MRNNGMLLALAVVALVAFSTHAFAGRHINGIGNAYAAYDTTGVAWGTTNWGTPPSGWYTPPQHLKLTVGLYNLNPTLVAQQLTAMRTAGETDIELPIWNNDFNGSDPDGVSDWVYGETVDNSLGQLRPQHQTNLINLLTAIKARGFKRVIVRFMSYWPTATTVWSETEYQKNWNFIYNTRNLVEAQLAGSGVASLYDLGGEMGGSDFNLNHQYTVRVWTDYLAHWGNAKTMGFSFAWGVGRYTKMDQWYAEVGGVRPSIWGYDLYPATGQWATSLGQIRNEMGYRDGDPIIILETWPNDTADILPPPSGPPSHPTATSVASELTAILADTTNFPHLNLDGLFQWTFYDQQTIANQGTTTQISNYRPMLASRRVDIANSYSAVDAITDVNCASTTGTCSVLEKWGAPPAGKYTVISVKSDANPTETLHECGSSAGSVTDPWIGAGSTIYFIARYQTTCTLTTAVPNSTSTVFVHTTSQP